MDRLSPLATPSATRAVLERHGLYTKYGLGQNFLVNDDIIRKIVALADLKQTDCVLEVGPGIGTLTSALLKTARHVVAIEMDRDLPTVLADTLSPWRDRFSLIEKDALDVQQEDIEHACLVCRSCCACNASHDPLPQPAAPRPAQAGPSSVPLPNKFIANLPYAVAATVVLKYFQAFDFLNSATVMVQKEVADRMMAQPGSKNYGAYTVKLGLFAQPAGRFSVASGNFFPPPRVDSAVLRLNRACARDETGKALTRAHLKATCLMADAAFANRRKTLANSCKMHFANRPALQDALPTLFAQAGVDPRRRGETLSQEEFIRLGVALQSALQSML